jgi:HEPN domain-containing protein
LNNYNLNEAKRWLEQAQYDLKSAAWNIEGGFFADACFKSQQACEKALKAFCYLQGERDLLGHSTRDFLIKSSKYDSSFNQYMTNCKRLDKFYITARYPDALPSGIPHEYFEIGEAVEAVKLAEEVIKYISQQVAKVV